MSAALLYNLAWEKTILVYTNIWIRRDGAKYEKNPPKWSEIVFSVAHQEKVEMRSARKRASRDGMQKP